MALTEITNYLQDDWDDNALTSRTSSAEGYFLHPSDNLTAATSDYEAGDALKGVYRPEWNTVRGTPTTISGHLQIQQNEAVETPSEMVVGSWTWDFDLSNNGTGVGDATYISNIGHSNQADSGASGNYIEESYFIGVSGNGSGGYRTSYNIHDGSSNTSLLGFVNMAATDSIEITRDSYGNFERFVGGASQGTATDTTYTTSRIQVFSGRDDATSRPGIDCRVNSLICK